MSYKQEGRILRIKTPLGDDVLLVESLDGVEALSKIFKFDLELSSEQPSIDPQDIVGKKATIYFSQVDGPERYYNGYVNRFWYVGRSERLSLYRAEIVPWLWFLTRTTNCRIFENKTVIDVVTQVFDDLGFSDYTLEIYRTYPPMEYCVQYRETDFNFVSRLLEQHGIFYFFDQEETRHTLHLADDVPAYVPCVENMVELNEQDNFSHLITWEHGYEYRSGKATNNDYNFETPKANLLADEKSILPLDHIASFDLYDYPGGYKTRAEGQDLAKMRIESDEAGWDTASGKSRCRSFLAGGTFTMNVHPDPAEQGRQYVLTSVHHHVELSGDYITKSAKALAPRPGEVRPASPKTSGGTDAELDYTNDFTCLPIDIVFRPPIETPKAIVRGAQTAVVVGPQGSEIYTDKYGRVKVEFFWDRKKTQSCWLRVGQIWAGAKWGAQFIPRIGQEVIVDFLEGDPDRPIITGCVYNADMMPPYDLPTNATQSGIKTRSSQKGSAQNFNELRFEDKKGSEQLYIQAEKDMDTLVKHDQTLEVDHDRKTTIKHDEQDTIEHDLTTHVKNDEKHTVDKQQTVKIGADRKKTVGGDESAKVDGNFSRQVGGNESIQIQGDFSRNVAGDSKSNSDGTLSETAEEITLTARSKVTITCGGSSIEITAGSIVISSPTVRIN